MKPWCFVHVTDIHYGSPRSFRYRPSHIENWETACGQIIGLKPDLLLATGDLAHDGWIHPHELERIRANLGDLPFPCHGIAGNMDVGNKVAHSAGLDDDMAHNIRSDLLKTFASTFGPYNWSFVHKNVRFTGFCDMLVGSGLPEEQQLWHWLESLKRQPRSRFHVCLMHYPLFVDALEEPTFDNCDRKQYLNWYDGLDKAERLRIFDMLKALDVSLVFSGHVHHNRTRYADGIRFETCTGTAFKKETNLRPDSNTEFGFICCKVSEGGLEPTFVPLERISTAEGYGPRGHLPERDYSLAWEQPSYGSEAEKD